MPRTTLAEIADRTKISMFFLKAIEDGDFDKLPGGIFDRSYIRQYAEAAGLDPEIIMERYREFLERRERAAQPAEPSRRSGTGSSIRELFSWGT